PEYRSIELGIYAVYPTRKHVAPKVRALVDFLYEKGTDTFGDKGDAPLRGKAVRPL
ncbi:MAG: LysR family transcriptional regulator, partial [Steroidobacteraceae bacterium]|nr:LysR family transcriptional regulator [Steroidobacteraceae bacterium]